MTIDQLLKYFGGSQTETANALGVKPQAVHQWVTKKQVPMGRQYQAEAISGGEIKAYRAVHSCTSSGNTPKSDAA